MLCNTMSENIRVYQNSLNTARDSALLAGVQFVTVAPSFAHCGQEDLTGYNVIPFTSPLPNNLADLLPFTPLTGIPAVNTDNTNKSKLDKMNRYYVSNFMLAMLNNDDGAFDRATTPSFDLVNKIYVDGVPGTVANNFNLQNKQIDMKLVKGKYVTTITNRSGDIPDPSSAPNALSLFGNGTWDDNIGQVSLLFNFPLQKGNLIDSTNTIAIHSNGFVMPESYMATVDGGYAAKRFGQWFEDRGSTTVALLGNNLRSQATITPASPDGKVWVSSTADRLQVTWYKVLSWDFPAVTAISAQCTLFPDGSIRLEYDNSIPAVIPSGNGNSNAILVGLSDGRLHVNGNGKYVPEKDAKVVSMTDVLNGKSTKNADAIYEVYTQAVTAQGKQPGKDRDHSCDYDDEHDGS